MVRTIGFVGLTAALSLGFPLAAQAASGQPDGSEESLVPPPADESDDSAGAADSADAEGSAGFGFDSEASSDGSLDAEADADADADADNDFGGDVSGSSDSDTSSNAAPAPSAGDTSSSGGIDSFKGRFGLGAIRTISGLNGINFRYFVADKFAIGANLGVALFTYRENDPATTDMCPGPECELENTRTVAALAASIEALYFARLGREAGRLPFRADFGFGGRFGFQSIVNDQDVEDNLDDPTELHIELPLVVQLMFGNNFALSPEFGVDFRIVPGSRADGDVNPGSGRPGSISPGAANGPGFGFNLGNGVGLFGGASMHYYF